MALIKPSSPVFNPAHPLARGLAGAWLFYEGGGDTINDLSGWHNDGTATSLTWTYGQYGKHINMNATSDKVACGLRDSLRITGHLTVAARVRTTTALANHPIVARWGADASYTLVFVSNQISFYCQVSNANKFAASGVSNIDAAWHTAVGVFDGANIKLSMNGGAFITGTATTGPLDNTADPFVIGQFSNGGNGFVGDMDYVQVWARALTINEIVQLNRDPYAAFRPVPTRIGLSVAAPSTTTVALTWTDNSVGETGYSIERSIDGINYSEIGTAAADATSYNDDTAALATTYYYQLKATGSPADSDYSNVATITTA